jgi:hypothetical protein
MQLKMREQHNQMDFKPLMTKEAIWNQHGPGFGGELQAIDVSAGRLGMNDLIMDEPMKVPRSAGSFVYSTDIQSCVHGCHDIEVSRSFQGMFPERYHRHRDNKWRCPLAGVSAYPRKNNMEKYIVDAEPIH